MTVHVFLALVYVLVFSCGSMLVQGGNSPPQVAAEANSVTQARSYKVGNELSPAEKEKILSEIRSFLWENLTHRQSARLRATFYTIEGDPTSYEFETESQDGKKWCVSANILLEHPSQRQKKLRKREMIFHNYCEIFRLDTESGLRIPDAEDRDAKTYKLRLRDVAKPDELTL